MDNRRRATEVGERRREKEPRDGERRFGQERGNEGKKAAGDPEFKNAVRVLH